jgi:hypothetical protein
MRASHRVICAALLVLHAAWLHAQETNSSAARFPALDGSEVAASLVESQPLPIWAQTLAPSLPKTTAAMLQLDALHRSENPLGPELAGKLRWIVARTLDCEYALLYAASDLARLGLTAEAIHLLDGDRTGLPKTEQAALDFARRMTLDAAAITDAEVAQMLELHTPEALVGIVHTVALANFQDRIFLALGISVEPDGPLPPLQSPLESAWSEIETPQRPNWDLLRQPGADNQAVPRPDWDDRAFEELAQLLESQKQRAPRIPMPEDDRFASLPPEIRRQAGAIVWSRVSMGYQPFLTKSWFDCMGTFQQEAKLDRVFSNSVFWVITRRNDCFY